MSATLLVELFTEELPPKSLRKLADAFAQVLVDQLVQQQFVAASPNVKVFGTPRRLAVAVDGVAARSPDQAKRDKILPVSVALDAQGQPTAPLLKKLAAMGLDASAVAGFERASDGKQDVLFHNWTAPGKALLDGLQLAFTQAVAKLPIPKVMNYQLNDGSTVQFVRPAHRLVALHGDQVVPIQALGLTADRVTEGHRFMGSRHIDLRDALSYEQQLADEGRVVASYDTRRASIVTALQAAAQGASVIMPDALLDEVNSLVEWPVVYEGRFEDEFLEVPQECLILTMQQNQKYFAMTDANGKMLSRFLLVSNLQSTDPKVVTGGNERVLRARLSDARFFFVQDRKRSLASRVDGLSAVVYHNKLGTQLQRVDRVARLAGELAGLLGADVARVRRAATLAKADLLTDMVGEFPELQGIMGTYYAHHDGEPDDVAQAITEQYQPRFAGDALPQTPTGTVLAIADKLETLTGIWGIGLQPTGEKDPFALRRHALGIVRMLVEKALPLDLQQIVGAAFALFADLSTVKQAPADVVAFMQDRLRGYLRDRGYAANAIEAVLGLGAGRIDNVIARLDAVRAFAALPEAASLSAANKRVTNILKKLDGDLGTVKAELLVEPAERALYAALLDAQPQADALFEQGQLAESLQRLAALREPVDAFFDGVMVMADDLALRANRIAMLAQMHRLMNRVADLARLAG